MKRIEGCPTYLKTPPIFSRQVPRCKYDYAQRDDFIYGKGDKDDSEVERTRFSLLSWGRRFGDINAFGAPIQSVSQGENGEINIISCHYRRRRRHLISDARTDAALNATRRGMVGMNALHEWKAQLRRQSLLSSDTEYPFGEE